MSDLLAWPVVGAVLRWRHLRTATRTVLLLVAAALVAHGLFGPQFAPTNLATLATWIHYRGLLIGVLLVAGNAFCHACPMVLARDLTRKVRTPTLRWPGRLHGKWLALPLFAAVLFAYEVFDLWEDPAATAWLIVGYFAGAIVVDTLFSGASFCKHVCPVGQFNFVASTLSPLEIRSKDQAVCASCRTFDCLKGRRAPEAPAVVLQRGCELHLFVPTKVGNLECTFCLDCVQACPHDNVALATRVPGEELSDDRRRSVIGRPSRRLDFAALALLFTFGGLVNAFAMTAPVQAVERWLAIGTRATSEGQVLAVLFVFGLGRGAGRPVGRGRLHHPPGRRRARHVHPGPQHRRELRLRADSDRLRRLAGALRLPFPDRPRRDRPGHAERGDRRLRPGDPG